MTFTLIDLSDSLFISVTFIIVDLFKLKKALYNLSKINALVYVEIFYFSIERLRFAIMCSRPINPGKNELAPGKLSGRMPQ